MSDLILPDGARDRRREFGLPTIHDLLPLCDRTAAYLQDLAVRDATGAAERQYDRASEAVAANNPDRARYEGWYGDRIMSGSL